MVARPLAIAGVTYYVASGVYYRPVYQGSTVVYQQVPNPELNSVLHRFIEGRHAIQSIQAMAVERAGGG